MKLKDSFTKQLKIAKPITAKTLSKLGGEYHSGRKYKVGDMVLHALLKVEENIYQMITLSEDEIGSEYVVAPGEVDAESELIPTVKKA